MRVFVALLVVLGLVYAAYAYATSSTPRFGDTGYAYYRTDVTTGVLLFETKRAYDAAIHARAAKDDYGFRNAVASGAFSVSAGTRVQVIDVDIKGALKVRVLEGPHRGKAGYTIRESVHKKRP